MASVTFAVRGNSFAPLYSQVANYAPFATDQNLLPTIASGSQAGLIGSNYIDLFQNSYNSRSVIWSGGANISTNAAISILVRASFNENASLQGVFLLGGPYAVELCPAMIYMFFSGSSLNIGMNDECGNNLIANDGIGSFSPTTGVFYDIVFTTTGDTTTNGVNVYVNNSLLGSATLPSSLQNPRNVNLITNVVAGGATFDVAGSSMFLNEMVIWNGVINPGSVALTTGTGALSGASRTAFVQAAAFNGGSYSDPGITNVLNGVNYTFAGVSETGTLGAITNVLTNATLVGQTLNGILVEN